MSLRWTIGVVQSRHVGHVVMLELASDQSHLPPRCRNSPSRGFSLRHPAQYETIPTSHHCCFPPTDPGGRFAHLHFKAARAAALGYKRVVWPRRGNKGWGKIHFDKDSSLACGKTGEYAVPSCKPGAGGVKAANASRLL